MTRPSDRTLAALALILTPLALSGWMVRARRLDVERRASAAASIVAGRPVRVHCPGLLKRTFLQEINHGSVKFYDGRPVDDTHLSGEACKGLGRLVREGPRLGLTCLQLDSCSADDTRVALGVSVLAHEAVHLRGVMDEAVTECTSVRWTRAIARSLGATEQAAAYLEDWKFSVAPDHLPEQYQSRGNCRAGTPG